MRRLVPAAQPCAHGFSVLELVIALIVVAILMAWGLPSFEQAMQKSRRSEAMAGLMQLMQAQERYRSNNASYFDGDLADLPGAPLALEHYTLAITADSGTATGYVATATARSTGKQHGDTDCRSLTITIDSGTAPAYSSKDAAGTVNNPERCWVK